ncbi:hypothetical protein [Rathayibacter agropyri]|uniref:hypothetical protein n=1 Tax=Rathayibacter agropyri TaxID=1634927 RepID=UPI00156569DD|nr:hypothetical protein [Rathayibacter agropyri]NRD08675.1 hypothetical protein [Rathayibacter agropyri]
MLLLSGCASGADNGVHKPSSIEFVSNAAVLDEATETVREPLDVYGPSVHDRQVLERASDLLAEDCVRADGHSVSFVNVLDYPPSTMWSLKYFGVWTKARASQAGLGMPHDALAEAHQRENEATSAETYDAIMQCVGVDSRSEEIASLSYRTPEESIHERGRTVTWSWASGDPIWAQAQANLGGCLAAQGYALDEQRASTSPKIAEAPDSEAGIRAALNQVECLSSTGAAQTFVDVVAAYQVAFIAENEGALVADKKETDERVKFAQKVISEHGGH